jgi:GNAT superfamily N-acetyltransferase
MLVDSDSEYGLVRGSAEFTLNFMVGDVPFVFFNRLVINPERARGHGYGTMLMNACLPYFDERRLTILNPMNPYDASMEAATRRFFRKFGFRPSVVSSLTIDNVTSNNLLVRLPYAV